MIAKPPITDFSPRINARVGNDPDRLVLRDIALRPEVQDDMFARVRNKQKPVTALSKLLYEVIGERARNDSLRQLAGEIAAFTVENRFDCIRSSGARIIHDDPVFTSGTSFKLGQPLPDDPVVAALIAIMPSDRLQALAQAISVEIERRDDDRKDAFSGAIQTVLKNDPDTVVIGKAAAV